MPADVKASQSSGGDVRPGERDKVLNLVLGQIERLIALTGADISTRGLGGFHVGWHG